MEGPNSNAQDRRGKGGNLQRGRNPFSTQEKRNNLRPAFGDTSDTGLVIDKILDAGNAILIGTTRDGSTVSLTILEGNERHRTYCSSPEELERALHAIMDLYTSP